MVVSARVSGQHFALLHCHGLHPTRARMANSSCRHLPLTEILPYISLPPVPLPMASFAQNVLFAYPHIATSDLARGMWVPVRQGALDVKGATLIVAHFTGEAPSKDTKQRLRRGLAANI